MSETDAPAPAPAVAPAGPPISRPLFDWNTLVRILAAGGILAMLFTLVLVRLMPVSEFELVAVAALAPLGVHLLGRAGSQD